MILAIDIGNTTVALGGIRDGRVCFVAHMDTVRTRTAAEYRAEMEKVFAHRRHPEKPIRFEGAVLTSVVPQITGALAECARYYTGKKPVIVSPDIRTGLTMGVPDPHAVGKDRLVDAAYAAANFPGRRHLPRTFHRSAGAGGEVRPAATGASFVPQKRHRRRYREVYALRLGAGCGCPAGRHHPAHRGGAGPSGHAGGHGRSGKVRHPPLPPPAHLRP